MPPYDPTRGQPVANLGRVLAEPPTPPSLFREACERIADMLKQDDGEAFFEAEKFLKRHAPELYDTVGMSRADLAIAEDDARHHARAIAILDEPHERND